VEPADSGSNYFEDCEKDNDVDRNGCNQGNVKGFVDYLY